MSARSSDAFLSWVLARGVQCEHARIRHSDDEGLGLIATADLPIGTAVMMVPLSAVIRVRPTGAVGALVSSLDQVHGLALTLCLASAAGGLEPWLALWPEAPLGGWELSAADWTRLGWWNELTVLRAQQKDGARRAYEEQVAPFCAEHASELTSPCPSWERFVWAVSMVESRAAGVEMSGDRRLVLAPLLDLLNHRSGRDSNARLCFELEAGDAEAEEGGRVVVRAKKAVAAGETLTITYGTKANAELLVAYVRRRTCQSPLASATFTVHAAPRRPGLRDAHKSGRPSRAAHPSSR